MKPEPCEFNSLELISMASLSILDAIAYPLGSTEYLTDALGKLSQAEAQLKYNNGAATPFPEKDPWPWEDADTYGPSA